MPVAHLPDRAVLELSGEDRIAFLQGLVSNDVATGAPVWAALLTPQGKWQADFFVVPVEGSLLLDVEAGQAEAVQARLLRFRLRSKVGVRARPELAVTAGWDVPAPPGAFADPRLPEAGWRLLSDAPPEADGADYEAHRLRLGLPGGSHDLEEGQSILLEAGFDELRGVSWTKGCYMGQELTARTRYRGLVKRRLVPVRVEGALPPRGTPVLREGVEVGEMRSGQGGRGMAVLRLAALRGEGALRCGDAVLHPEVPQWMRLPEAADA
ncbi:CAF17-like 4Fe-4S cluster assembly/insertion protein YgfZ [Sabulicella glaciei]|uniref:Folate-binding protein n=1 Tax=Sabulicella glaciei TaxID=2984948 RepID=A0ABT3NSF0_9PROT|nr:folate-binding protein [Roseococcus sp. MDT2-1-1]MCW8085086.1 folate-binding protein [Roseococcus sp. MDT2-1-1]